MQSIERDRDRFNAGRDKEKVEIAENLLEMNLSIEDVSKGTGLSIDEVEKLVMK